MPFTGSLTLATTSLALRVSIRPDVRAAELVPSAWLGAGVAEAPEAAAPVGSAEAPEAPEAASAPVAAAEGSSDPADPAETPVAETSWEPVSVAWG